MKYTDFLEQKKEIEIINEAPQTPEDILRKGGYKIKLVTKTAFGTQFDLAKTYPEEEITQTLKDFNIKIRGKSVFIVN